MLKLFLKDVKAGGDLPLGGRPAQRRGRAAGVEIRRRVLLGERHVRRAHPGRRCPCSSGRTTPSPFVHSLPVTRAMVVRARYLTAAAIGLLSLLVGATVGAARGFGLAAQGAPWPRWVAGDMALAFVLAFAVDRRDLPPVLLPVGIRQGQRGRGARAGGRDRRRRASSGRRSSGVPAMAAGRSGARGVPPGRIPQGVAVSSIVSGWQPAGSSCWCWQPDSWRSSAQVAVRARAAGILGSAEAASRGEREAGRAS